MNTVNICKATAWVAAVMFGVSVAPASAGVAYDPETTNDWFSVSAGALPDGDISVGSAVPGGAWSAVPQGGSATVADAKINVDSDQDDPLVYRASTPAASSVARFSSTLTVTSSLTLPDVSTAKVAVCVCTNTSSNCLEWKAQIGGAWQTLDVVTSPVEGAEYEIVLEADSGNGRCRLFAKKAGDSEYTALTDGWVTNSSLTNMIESVAFSGSTSIGSFEGKYFTPKVYTGTLDGNSLNFASNINWDGPAFPAAGDANATVDVLVPSGLVLTVNGSAPPFEAMRLNVYGTFSGTGVVETATFHDGSKFVYGGTLAGGGVTVAAGDRVTVQVPAATPDNTQLITWSSLPAGTFALVVPDATSLSAGRALAFSGSAMTIVTPAAENASKYYAVEDGSVKMAIPDAWVSTAVGSSGTEAAETALATKPAGSTLAPWEAYVLGYDAEASKTAKPFVDAEQTADAGKLRISLEGLPETMRAETGATVTFDVQESTSPSFTTGVTTNSLGGAKSVDVDLPASGAKYFRIGVNVALP